MDLWYHDSLTSCMISYSTQPVSKADWKCWVSAKWNSHIWNRLRDCYSRLYTGTLKRDPVQSSNFRRLKINIWKVALHDIIYDITSHWYYIWYHSPLTLYDIIDLWYHRPMISYFMLYDIIHDVNDLWYHRSMISFKMVYDIRRDIRYDIIFKKPWYHN